MTGSETSRSRLSLVAYPPINRPSNGSLSTFASFHEAPLPLPFAQQDPLMDLSMELFQQGSAPCRKSRHWLAATRCHLSARFSRPHGEMFWEGCSAGQTGTMGTVGSAPPPPLVALD